MRDKTFFIDLLALSAIGVYCFFSSLFGPNFAKFNIWPPFLKFPIFVGELLFFMLLLLLAIKWLMTKQRIGMQYGCWGVYSGWILAMSLVGYVHWGPLALRNAAMFYYIIFFLIGSSFYNRQIFTNPWIYGGLSMVLAALICSNNIIEYYWFSLVVLFSILLYQIKSRIIFFSLAIGVFAIHIDNLFYGSRSHMVGVLVSIVFIFLVFLLWNKKNIKAPYFFGAMVLFSVALFFGFKNFSDSNAIKSMVNPGEVIELYKSYKNVIEQKEGDYEAQVLPIALYHPAVSLKFFTFNQSAASQPNVIVANQSAASQPNVIVVNQSAAASQPKGVVANQPVPGVLIPIEYRSPPRSLDTAYNNILFRCFIWEDMWDELLKSHSLFGVGFGKPQRSKSIEILGWASEEWKRDGWIAPHNSYFHMIYRAGVVGVLINIGIIYLFIQLLKDFTLFRSVKGILCLGVLLYWLVMANFLLILEFPYNAILFWSLFGMTFAYAQDLKALKRVKTRFK